MSCSQYTIINDSSRSCVIVVLNLFFTIFNLENFLSVEALETGKVNAMRSALFRVGNTSIRPPATNTS